MLQYIKNKRVLFITTKNPDYIRNTQEIAFLEEHASFYTVIASTHTSYPKRLLSIYRRLLTVPMNEYDSVPWLCTAACPSPFCMEIQKRGHCRRLLYLHV